MEYPPEAYGMETCRPPATFPFVHDQFASEDDAEVYEEMEDVEVLLQLSGGTGPSSRVLPPDKLGSTNGLWQSQRCRKLFLINLIVGERICEKWFDYCCKLCTQ